MQQHKMFLYGILEDGGTEVFHGPTVTDVTAKDDRRCQQR